VVLRKGRFILVASVLTFAALFFGLLRACFFALEIEAGVPSVTGMALQGLVIVLMLVLTQTTMMARLPRK